MGWGGSWGQTAGKRGSLEQEETLLYQEIAEAKYFECNLKFFTLSIKNIFN